MSLICSYIGRIDVEKRILVVAGTDKLQGIAAFKLYILNALCKFVRKAVALISDYFAPHSVLVIAKACRQIATE